MKRKHKIFTATLSMLVCILMTVVLLGYTTNTGNYMESHDDWRIGNSYGALTGALYINSTYGTLYFGDTAVTSTADDINAIDGLFASGFGVSEATLLSGLTGTSAVELNQLYGWTGGTGTMLNLLNGLTVGAVELNQLNGWTGGSAVELGQLNGWTGGDSSTLNYLVDRHGTPGVANVDFTGACADADTVTIGLTAFEFDTNSAFTTGAIQVDVNASQAAADCATALVAAVNGSTAPGVDAILLTDVVGLVGETINDGWTLAETGGNITASHSSAEGETDNVQNHMHLLEYTVSSGDVTTTTAENGAIIAGGVPLTSAPSFWTLFVKDTNGQPLTYSNCKITWVQVNSNYYALKIVETQSGSTDLTASDSIQVVVFE